MKRSKSSTWINDFESLALPVTLLLTGLILIGGDRVGLLSLDRIQNLWPVALILVGLSELLTSGDQSSPATDVTRSSQSQTGARSV